MSRLQVIAGGSPTRAQAAAILSAVQTVLEAERTSARDPLPAAYRSLWRRAGIASARRGRSAGTTTWGGA